MSVLGNRVLRTEDPRMLTEGARYVADLRPEGAAHACFVRSTVAHGRLIGVDTAEARTQPGVLGVFTAADLDLPDLKPVPMVNQSMTRPVVARDAIRFVGEAVAVIVAETAAAAADAAEHVVVDIEPQPAVVDLTEAAAGDALVMETPTPLNPLGAKGIGESGTVGSGPAVLNAVCDAVAHLGIDHIDMPATPQRIWKAISARR